MPRVLRRRVGCDVEAWHRPRRSPPFDNEAARCAPRCQAPGPRSGVPCSDTNSLRPRGGGRDIFPCRRELTTPYARDEQRMERCDLEGTSGPLEDAPSVTACSACGKTWP